MRRLTTTWLIFLASCSPTPAPDSRKPESVSAPEIVDQDTPLNRRVLEIAREYQGYGVVDAKFSYVDILCRVFEPPGRISKSDDAATHGDKLYLLYAKDWDAYVKGIEKTQPEGQVIVKEAWESRVSEKPDTGFTDDTRPVRMQPAQKDGRWHMPTKKHALFVMLKSPDGWKYGTVSGDGARVYQSGVISSCASCHQKVGPDSLFGLPGRPPDR